MRRWVGRLLSIVLVAVAGAVPPAAARAESGLTDLTPDGGESRAVRVDAAGDVLGSTTPVPDGTWTGQLWRAGRATALASGTHAQALGPNGTAVGCTADGVGLIWRHGSLIRVRRAGQSVCFYGVNGSGEIIGTSAAGSKGAPKAFVYRNGGFTYLPTPSNRGSYPVGINDDGQIVGRLIGTTTSVPVRTVVWAGGRATDVGTLGGNQSVPTAISESGEVIGVSKLAGGASHPFSWRHGQITDLLAAAGVDDPEAYVSAVNAAGDIVGTVNGRPVLWRDGTLGYLAPRGVTGEAVAVNDNGQVAGVVRSASGAPTVFRWTSGELAELPSLPGSEYQYPVGIDGRGRVVGNVSVADTNHAVIWS